MHFLAIISSLVHLVDLKLNILILLNDIDHLVMVSPMCCIVNDLLTDVEHAVLHFSGGQAWECW